MWIMEHLSNDRMCRGELCTICGDERHKDTGCIYKYKTWTHCGRISHPRNKCRVVDGKRKYKTLSSLRTAISTRGRTGGKGIDRNDENKVINRIFVNVNINNFHSRNMDMKSTDGISIDSCSFDKNGLDNRKADLKDFDSTNIDSLKMDRNEI